MTTDELILLNMRNEYLRKDRDYQTTAMQLWRDNLRIARGMESVGLWNSQEYLIDMYCRYGRKVEVQASDLPKLRTVFPQVKDTGEYSVENAEENTVRVWLDLGIGNRADSWSVNVYYVKRLPPEARCKIERRYEPIDTVVCGVTE